jgi:hypothetical protein
MQSQALDPCALGSDVSISPAKINPEDFPIIDTLFVGRVLCGHRDLRRQLGSLAFDPDAGGPRRDGAPCPFGTRPCPPDCRSVNVWGLSKKTTKEELLSLCRNFSGESDIQLLEAEGDGDQAHATITFMERWSAQITQFCLHRTSLHGKEIHKQDLV